MGVAYGWPNIADTATLSGGSWSLALTKLQNSDPTDVARTTTDANADEIINVDFGAAKSVGVVALVRHNLRSAARWRIRGASDSGITSVLYDSQSGGINPLCWPEQWASGVLPTGHPNYATRLLTDAQINALNPLFDVVHVLSTETAARYWRIEFFDTSNTDNYLQAGRLVMAPLFRPTYNFAVGSDIGFNDVSAIGRSLSGGRFSDDRPLARTFSHQFTTSPDSEALTVFRDMQAEVRSSGQVYVVSDTNDTYNLQRRSALCCLTELTPVVYNSAGFSTVQLKLEEVR